MQFNLNTLLKDTILFDVNKRFLQALPNMVIATLLLIIIALVVDKVLRQIIIGYINRTLIRSQTILFKVIGENQILNALSLISIALIFELGTSLISHKSQSYYIIKYSNFISQLCYFMYFFIVALTIARIVDAISDFYERKIDINREYPIYGYIKMLKFGIWGVAILTYIPFLLNKSLWVMITGIGAASAFVLFIFKDAVSGLISNISATANQIVKLGDWVNIPKYNTDGEIIHISITTIKILNWDNTITTIPTFALTADAIHNWQAVVDCGARRIMRSVFIDANSIKPCSDELLDRLSARYPVIGDWLNKANPTEPIANVTLFRIYINHYLTTNNLLHQNYPNLLRHLQPTPQGIPLQIYAYSKQVELKYFEPVQAQIFEHIYMVLPEFELVIFQTRAMLVDDKLSG